MKETHAILGGSIVVALGIGILVFNLQDEQSASAAPPITQKSERQDTPPPSQKTSTIDLDSLAREVAPEKGRIKNHAGHIIIATADTKDAEKTDALLKSFARGEAHLNHMRRENAFVTRRQIVELPETVTEIGEKIRSGEKIEKILIPDFDGGTFEMTYNPNLMGPNGEENGTLLGTIADREYSNVILGYYEDATSGYVNLPDTNRVLEYMTVGGKQIVVKEIDLAARNIAEPCGLCEHHNGQSPHPAGAAHHVAQGLGE